MKGNLKNLNDIVGGTIVRTGNGKIGVVRFLMGEVITSGLDGDIKQARVCITFKQSETYATYRGDGISHESNSFDIHEIISIGDGKEIKSDKTARDMINA